MLIRTLPKTAQRRPAEAVVCVEALAVDTARTAGVEEAAAFERRRRGDVQKVQDGGRNVQQAARPFVACGAPRGAVRPVHDQRYPQRAFIDEVAVAVFAVLAQAFAVVR